MANKVTCFISALLLPLIICTQVQWQLASSTTAASPAIDALSGDCIDGPSTWYRGTRSVTAKGVTCQRWDTDRPHKPKHVPKDGGHHNYCRNPDHDEKGTWCYTVRNDTRWQYCDIPKCPDDSLFISTHYDASSESSQFLKVPADPAILKLQTDSTGTYNVSFISGSNHSMTEYWAIAADYKQHRIFFTDKREGYLGVWDMVKKTTKKHLEGMVYGIENLAYDWVTENLYWTDSDLKWVMVADKTFRYYTPVYKTAPDPAYGLAVHSIKRLLFFSVFKPVGSKIIVTDLAGKNPTILFKYPDVNDVKGIAIDYTDDRLYWTDFTGYGGKVMSSLLDGTNKTQHVYKEGSFYWGVSAYMDYLYFSDVNGHQAENLKYYYSFGMVSKKGKQVYRYTLSKLPRGIAIYSRNQQFSLDRPPSFGSCEESGAYSQICLPRTNSKRVCACSPGYHLDEVSNYCRTKLRRDEYLLIVDAGQGKLFQVPITSQFADTIEYSAVPIRAAFSKEVTTAVDSKYVYWSHQNPSKIVRSSIDGSRFMILSRTYANSMAVDPHTGNLFYSDPESNTIVVSSKYGIYSRTIVIPESSKSLLTSIKMITLDTKHNKIYWTDTFSKEGKGQVLRCRYDGTEKEVVLENLNWPHAITTDYETNKLYVVEAKIALIYEAELTDLVEIKDTSFKQRIFKQYDVSPYVSRKDPYVLDLKVHQGMAYILDGESNRLQRFRLSSGADSMAPYGPAEFYKLTSLSVYSESSYANFTKSQSNPCKNLKCREICVSLKDSQARCLCEDGKFMLGPICIGGRRQITVSTKRTSTTFFNIGTTTPIGRSAVTTTESAAAAKGTSSTEAMGTSPYPRAQFTTTSIESAAAAKGTSSTDAMETSPYPRAQSTTTSTEDCIDGTGISYRGYRAVTRRGITCQRWDTDRPHKPKHVPKDGGHHNYCRNPDNDVMGTWCYTTDSSIRWDYCNIAKCDSTTAATTKSMPTTAAMPKETTSSLTTADMYPAPMPANVTHKKIDGDAKEKDLQIEEELIKEKVVSVHESDHGATIDVSQIEFGRLEFVKEVDNNVVVVVP